MELRRILNIIFWLRTIFLTALLWLAFETGLLKDIAPSGLAHDTSAFSAFTTAYLLVWLAPSAVYVLVSQLWNKVTPLKNKPTLIENEVVYVLSVLSGIPVFTAVFLNTTFGDLPALLGLLLLTALPGSICSYFFQRMNRETLLTPKKEDHNKNEAEENSSAPILNIMAYLTAAIIFAIALTISSGIVVFLKIGWQPSLLSPIVLSIASISGSSVLLLTLFGHLILPFGVKIKSKLGLRENDTRIGIATSWVLGVMTIVTICLIFFGGIRPPRSMDALIASWHLWTTYGLFGLSSFLGGLALRAFYKPKSVSVIFT